MNEHQTLTAIGWIWLGLGVLAFVSGVGVFLVSTITGLPTSPLPMRSVGIRSGQSVIGSSIRHRLDKIPASLRSAVFQFGAVHEIFQSSRSLFSLILAL